ncbi:PilZ domain-containing protein [Aeoliella straminimaris]|uniref:PilZ domain-containing protein n=1 Tax=Aeoliella straminimaris TaxID=2954799 RepID=UPI003CC56881
MLDCSDHPEIVIPKWEDVEIRARLPLAVHEFLAKEGPAPAKYDCERRHARKYFRTRAVIRRDSHDYGVYMCDISRSGVGFYSPIQLFPEEPVELWLPSEKRLDLLMENCVRHANNSYRCGATFVSTK